METINKEGSLVSGVAGRLEEQYKKLIQYRKILNNADKVFQSLQDEGLKREFSLEYSPIVKNYSKTVKETKELLEEQFKWERTENAPISLTHRRLYNALKQEIKGLV